MIIRMVINR